MCGCSSVARIWRSAAKRAAAPGSSSAAASDLERDRAAEDAVGALGAVDLAHAALAESPRPAGRRRRACRAQAARADRLRLARGTRRIDRAPPAAIAPPPRPPRRRRPRARSAPRAAAGSPSISTAAPNTASTRDQNSGSATGPPGSPSLGRARRLRPVERAVQPGAREGPVPLDGGRRDAEHLAGLLDGEPGEVSAARRPSPCPAPPRRAARGPGRRARSRAAGRPALRGSRPAAPRAPPGRRASTPSAAGRSRPGSAASPAPPRRRSAGGSPAASPGSPRAAGRPRGPGPSAGACGRPARRAAARRRADAARRTPAPSAPRAPSGRPRATDRASG